MPLPVSSTMNACLLPSCLEARMAVRILRIRYGFLFRQGFALPHPPQVSLRSAAVISTSILQLLVATSFNSEHTLFDSPGLTSRQVLTACRSVLATRSPILAHYNTPSPLHGIAGQVSHKRPVNQSIRAYLWHSLMICQMMTR